MMINYNKGCKKIIVGISLQPSDEWFCSQISYLKKEMSQQKKYYLGIQGFRIRSALPETIRSKFYLFYSEHV